MKRIAIIGECMIELNGEPFGPMQQAYGGDSLNSAIYLARTTDKQIDIQYVSALGQDAVSHGMIERWQREGINTDLVLRDDKRQPGLYLIQLDSEGERTFLYWRNQSAARYLLQHPNFPCVEQALPHVDMVYLSGISLAVLPRDDRTRLIGLLTQLKSQGVEIAFDTNYRPALWEKAEEARYFYRQMFEITDLALVTNDDEQNLWGDKNETASLQRLKDQGVKQVALKMGSKGNIFCNFKNNEILEIPTQPIEKVIDTTSAGDSFNAGFLAGWLLGKTPTICSEQGHRLAGLVIQHKGAIIPADTMQHIQFSR
ncbi:sugar kinase [Vibrio rotiferianus]|uniref:sugar kinase n=1 Tax=Vibrio rotiferianus TaxID=190895 RepID=UPI000B59DC68|nr:sugar kinase [Vibrio rotiferianus]ASI94170.1 ketodeoxygluconokinase [Vibrio rotiferianus]